MKVNKILSMSIIFLLMGGVQISLTQPGGGDWDGCADLDAETCEMVPFCELLDDGSCVETDDWGGGWDECADLGADECEASWNCDWNEEDGICEDHDGGGGGWFDCSDIEPEICDIIPFCEIDESGECVASDWGWGDCGDGLMEWGYGDWDWEDGGYVKSDINTDTDTNDEIPF